jgi:predicted nucleotidyltransferase
VDSRLQTILKDLRARLEAIYGDRLVRLVLYGSQARGDGAGDSDIDVVVVLKGPLNYWEELRRTEETVASLCLEHDAVVSTIFLTPKEADESRNPIPVNIRREGIVV